MNWLQIELGAAIVWVVFWSCILVWKVVKELWG
jgi:hypothetical protein